MKQQILTILLFGLLITDISAQSNLHFDIQLLCANTKSKSVTLEIVSDKGERFDLGNIKKQTLKIDLATSNRYTLLFKKEGRSLKNIIIDTNCPSTYAQSEPMLIKVLIPEKKTELPILAGTIQFYKEFQKFYYKKEESLL